MKRLFALIGLSYLSVLTIVFYFFSLPLFSSLVLLAGILILSAIFVKPLKSKRTTAILFGLSVLAACVSYILYSMLVYQPLVEKYHGSEIELSGYVCEEVQTSYNSYVYTICTDTVNGEQEKVKILLSSYTNLGVKDFDEVDAKVTVLADITNFHKSKKIFLSADTEENFFINSTGEKRKTLYYYAVQIRIALKDAIDNILPDEYASLCKAVLLGDKNALPYDVKEYFYMTGTSHIIVVSGLHLSILIGFILSFVRRITENRKAIALITMFSVFCFMAITGFSPSVIRSGVMLILTQLASLIFRNSDSLNSLGVSALVITLSNPYAVGDIGMICSFAATAGIILWADPMSDYAINKLKIKKRFLQNIVKSLSVSVAATLWVLPISFIAFNRISPYSPIVTVITEPLIGTIIVCSLFCAVFYLCPFVSFLAYPFGLIAALCGKLVIRIEALFASLPYSNINADRSFLIIWITVTAILAVTGFFIKNDKPFYVKCSIVTSLLVFVLGWTISFAIDYNNPKLTVWDVGKGITVSVENGKDISLLSCGGYASKRNEIIEEVAKRYHSIKNFVIYSDESKYSGYKLDFVNQFDVSNVLLYDNEELNDLNLPCENLNQFFDNETFSLALGSQSVDEIKNVDGVTYQFVEKNGISVLICPADGNTEKLPQEYLTADVLITDGLPENFREFDCDSIIFTGNLKAYNTNYQTLNSMTKNLIYATQKIEISLNDGGIKWQ